ncbi:MAG TPA: AraC family transcriptional regulator [Steroidobacteraceae bacterium]|nr:AraC family transcriptional regulator [Steroidobacteraceae bacterium]
MGLSRSVLAERFTDLVGMPPMQYLAKWRTQIAIGILSDARANIALIAETIGYESEAAFKKGVGVPPSVWRRRRPSFRKAAGDPALSLPAKPDGQYSSTLE